MSENIVDHSCARTDWQTPEKILRPTRHLVALSSSRLEAGTEISARQIGLDPCSCAENPTHADRFFHLGSGPNGLVAPWSRSGQPEDVFVNPPYGSEIVPREWGWRGAHRKTIYAWIEKTVREAEAMNRITLLISSSARVDQPGWQQLYCTPRLTAICFPLGRIKFIDPQSGETRAGNQYPSELYFFNYSVDRVRSCFGSLGAVLPIAHW